MIKKISLISVLAIAFLMTPAAKSAYPIAAYGSVFVRDASGALFIAGSTNAQIFPTTDGAYQRTFVRTLCDLQGDPCYHGFIAKLNAAGDQLIWATFLGGSISEDIFDLALDSAGNVWVTGRSSSLDFPVTDDAFQTQQNSGFLSAISPDGSRLVYSTFVGAPGEPDDPRVAIDAADSVYVAGFTASAGFPSTPGAYRRAPAPGVTELYIVKFDSRARKLVYSTVVAPIIFNYYGFHPILMAFDSSGTLHVACGTEASLSPPITGGVYSHPSKLVDIFLAAPNADGSDLLFSTVIGGSGNESPFEMIIDEQDDIYLAGTSYGVSNLPLPPPDFPVTPNALQTTYGPSFLMKLSSHATQLLYSTFLGATPTSEEMLSPSIPIDMLLDSDRKIHLLLESERSDFPLSPTSAGPCFPQYFQYGNYHFVYARLSAALDRIEYATALPRVLNGSAITGPFMFDTSGTIYYPYATSDEQYYQTLDAYAPPGPGPACLAEYVTQSRFTANASDTPGSGFPNYVVPGMLVSIYGPGIGPDDPVRETVGETGTFPQQAAGVQVSFDGMPAPILYASPARIDAVVPFGINTGGTTTVSVIKDGNPLGSLTYLTSQSNLHLFSQNGTGYGPGAWNQDGSQNSATNPAKIGDTISFYATGAGLMTPVPLDGAVPQAPKSQLDLGTCLPPNGGGCERFTGMDCQTVYAGDAPGQVEGIVQFNCILGPHNNGGHFNNQPTLYYIWAPFGYSAITPGAPVYIK